MTLLKTTICVALVAVTGMLLEGAGMAASASSSPSALKAPTVPGTASTRVVTPVDSSMKLNTCAISVNAYGIAKEKWDKELGNVQAFAATAEMMKLIDTFSDTYMKCGTKTECDAMDKVAGPPMQYNKDYQTSHFNGNLISLKAAEQFLGGSIKELLNLSQEIGVAIRDICKNCSGVPDSLKNDGFECK